ncbi:MAG: hypothetical protein ACK5MV_00040 [Aminipila sp.]
MRQQVYSDFSGGYNDTVSAISLRDNELALSENADYSAEVKAFKTRKGCGKVNSNSYGAEITDGHSWTVGSVYKKCVVKGGKIYELNANGTLTEKITLTSGATQIYPFQLYNCLYFGDGTKLYVWGDFDYSTELGTQTIKNGDIVRNNGDTAVKGNFYQALGAHGSTDLSKENFATTSRWQDVTAVRYTASNVARELQSYEPATAEVVELSIMSGASTAGTITLVMGKDTFTCAIAANDTVAQIVDKIMAITTSGWTKTKSANKVIFTKTEKGLCENGYFDPSITGITATYTVKVEGKTNDNNLGDIKKCTMFVVHPSSFRVFAAGNPDDNALYYSEIGKANYFKSDLNKMYPSSGYGKITAISLLSDSVLVSYENGWYAWNGITPLEDATWKALNIPYGCVCHDSVALLPNSFMFMGKDGLYNVSASILNSELVMIYGKDTIKKVTENRLENTIKEITNKSRCKGIFYDNVYYLAFLDKDGINKVLKYEWDTKSFTIVTGWKVNQWLADPEHLYFASKNYVLKANDGLNDIDVETGNAKPIHLRIKTKEYALGNELSQKCLQLLGLIFKQTDEEESEVDIKLLMGYEHKEISNVDLVESLTYGRAWGKTWGYRESIVKMVEVIRTSNVFQLEIESNTLNNQVTLLAIGFIYEDTDLVMPNILNEEELLK